MSVLFQKPVYIKCTIVLLFLFLLTSCTQKTPVVHANLYTAQGELVADATLTEVNGTVAIDFNPYNLTYVGKHVLRVHEGDTCLPPNFKTAGDPYDEQTDLHSVINRTLVIHEISKDNTSKRIACGVIHFHSQDDSSQLESVEQVPLKFEEIQLAEEIFSATDLKFLPGSDEFLILQKNGLVIHLQIEEGNATRLGNFRIPVHDNLDCGLVSLTFDPDFQTNKFIYFGHCVNVSHSRITRFIFNTTNYSAIPNTATEIIEVGDPDATKEVHNLGAIGFDAHGNLWGVIGDKHNQNNAQGDQNLGALLRIVPNEEGGYRSATDNPFIDDDIKSPDVYAYELRAPWKATIDSFGRYWIGDVGGTYREELNVVTAGGQNFGWPFCEGPCDNDNFFQPLRFWTHKQINAPFETDDPEVASTLDRVVWVGVEYNDKKNDRYQGMLTDGVLYGDFCAGWIRSIRVDQDGRVIRDNHVGNLRFMTGSDQGKDGYLYFTTYPTIHGNYLCSPAPEGWLSENLLRQTEEGDNMLDEPKAPAHDHKEHGHLVLPKNEQISRLWRLIG